VYVDPALAGVFVDAKGTGRLTTREREVLRLAADGLSSEKIGERLFLSPQTVRGHVGNAMGKLQAHTRTQAVATALRERLIAYLRRRVEPRAALRRAALPVAKFLGLAD